ncbi:MAG: hypothetical protein F7B59_01510 [Desulfurococcales archaeon]|nr:hypothetical protein [Desulfurococcales archaeon]
MNERFSACMDASTIDPLKIIVLIMVLVPGVSYALIADPIRGGWSVLYLSFLYLLILLLKDKPPAWATLTIAFTLLLTNLIVISHIPTEKTVYPLLIVERHSVEHPPVEGVYKVSYIDISQVFIVIEAVRIYLKCRKMKTGNSFKSSVDESNNTPKAAVV